MRRARSLVRERWIAGFGAGITESLLAVTPFESIKTQLYVSRHIQRWKLRIADASLFAGLMTANRPVLGCAAFFTVRASSLVNRASGAFSVASYPLRPARLPILQRALEATPPLSNSLRATSHRGEKLSTASTFAIGGLAGIITVYALLLDYNVRGLEAHEKTDMLHSHLTPLRRGLHNDLDDMTSKAMR